MVDEWAAWRVDGTADEMALERAATTAVNWAHLQAVVRAVSMAVSTGQWMGDFVVERLAVVTVAASVDWMDDVMADQLAS